MVRSNLTTKLGILLLTSAMTFYSCSKGNEEVDPIIVEPNYIDLDIEQEDSVAASDVLGSTLPLLQNEDLNCRRDESYEGLENYISGIETEYVSLKGNNVYLDNQDGLQYLYVSIPANTSFSLNLQEMFFDAELFDAHHARATSLELSNYSDEWTFMTGQQSGQVILKLHPQYYNPRHFNESAFVNENSNFGYPSQYDSLTLGTENFREQVELINSINKGLYETSQTDNPIDILTYITQLDPAQYSDKGPSAIEEITLNTIRSNGIPSMIVEGYHKETNQENWLLSYIGNYGWISSDPKNGISVREFNPSDYAIKISDKPLPEGATLYPISIFELAEEVNLYLGQLNGIREEEGLPHSH